MTIKAIVWCEKSQRVARALIKHGIDTTSCDILPCEHPEWGIPHIQDDARNHLTGYYLGIGHPDCTRIANSGVRWLFIDDGYGSKIIDPERYALMIKDCEFFNTLYNADIPHIGLENPIQHKYARLYIRHYDQMIQPKHFGDLVSKATCLWLKNLPPLMSKYSGTDLPVSQSVWREPPGENRKANRSRTFEGIAEAMASQWAYYLKGEKR
jgi:hypothetical protein